MLHHFLSATAPNLLGCRCRATEAAGLLFEGLGGSCAQLRALAPALMEMGLKVRKGRRCGLATCRVPVAVKVGREWIGRVTA